MRNVIKILIGALALLPLAVLAQDGPGDHPHSNRFDGKWQTTVSCDASRGALGFSYRFLGEIKDGNFHGLHGTEGEPGYLLVNGSIEDDGTGRLYAEGMTGSKEFVPGTDTAKGTEFGYHVHVELHEKHGEGERIEGRHCSYEFEKQ
jgi:hypothetical protein